MAHELERGVLHGQLQDYGVSRQRGVLVRDQHRGHLLRHQGRATQRQVTLDTPRQILHSLLTPFSLSLPLSVVAKWLRAHDPPAPWDVHATNACLAALAKKAGMPIMTIEDGNPDHESREYQPGERIEFFGQQPKDVPVAVLVKMAKWLVSEGAPCAAEMAEVSDTLPSPSPSLACKPNHD